MISAQSINPYKVQGRVTRIIGSGFIYDSEGLIITNSHVAFGRQALYVTLDDGTMVPARLLGADPIFDIAVLQIPKPDKGKLATVALGDSEHLRVGENVIAINGAPTPDADKIAPVMRALKVGSTLTMSVFRNGATREVTYTLPERPLLPGDLPEKQAGLQQPTLSPRHDKP
jgi:S1-C subfamily serine protease